MARDRHPPDLDPLRGEWSHRDLERTQRAGDTVNGRAFVGLAGLL